MAAFYFAVLGLNPPTNPFTGARQVVVGMAEPHSENKERRM
jgi:hypothetical protein